MRDADVAIFGSRSIFSFRIYSRPIHARFWLHILLIYLCW